MSRHRLTSPCVQRLNFTGLGRRQQFRERREVAAAGGCEPERRVQVDPDHMAARGEPRLALAGEEHVPRLVLWAGDQGVLAVGAGPAVVAAGAAVVGPSARPEVPAAEGAQLFLPR